MWRREVLNPTGTQGETVLISNLAIRESGVRVCAAAPLVRLAVAAVWCRAAARSWIGFGS